MPSLTYLVRSRNDKNRIEKKKIVNQKHHKKHYPSLNFFRFSTNFEIRPIEGPNFSCT